LTWNHGLTDVGLVCRRSIHWTTNLSQLFSTTSTQKTSELPSTAYNKRSVTNLRPFSSLFFYVLISC